MQRPKLRFKISLRALLLLILVLGLWLGLTINRSRRQSHAITEVKKYNGYVDYDYQFLNGKDIDFGFADGKTGLREKSGLPEQYRLGLGDDYFHQITRIRYIDQPPSDATLAPLESLNQIEELLFLRRTHHSLTPVVPPPGLERLTDKGLIHLNGLTNLRRLEIEGQLVLPLLDVAA